MISERMSFKKRKQIVHIGLHPPDQVLLRWGLQHGMSLIPKTTKVDRMVENLDVFGFELTPAEMSTLDALNCNKRYNDPAEFCKDMGGPCPIYC